MHIIYFADDTYYFPFSISNFLSYIVLHIIILRNSTFLIDKFAVTPPPDPFPFFLFHYTFVIFQQGNYCFIAITRWN